jgi:dihydrofolate reductase
MRKLVINTFMSLDGVMQSPGGPDEDPSGGFGHGGWATTYFDEAMMGRMAELEPYELLLGRRTYEIFAATWPLAEADDPVGAKLNAMPKYVASRTLGTVTWTNSTLLTGDVPEAVRELKRADDDVEIQVHGSPRLLQTLLAHDLVDEFLVFTFPVLIGSGTRLFGAGTAPGRLRLTDVTSFGGGVVACTYVRDGKLEYGAMGPETGNW